MGFEIRELTKEHVPAFRQAISAGFGEDADMEDEGWEARFAALFDLDRMFPAFDGDTVVGTGGDFGLTVTVPGGSQVPMSGLTVVAVRPTHTRQGVLTAMMREHFHRARQRNEPLGGLWASEATIYSRFDYGPAVSIHDIKLDARHAGRGGNEPGVTVRIVEEDEAKATLPGLFEAAQQTRPGMFRRTDAWWTHRLFYDPKKWRDGASALRHAVAEHQGQPVGYVSYRQKPNWDLLAEGEVRIRELIPVTDAAYRALWHYIASIDLFPIVKYWNNPPDDPLQFLVRDGRAVATTGVSDSMWLCLIDLPAALEERTYGASGRLVMAVADSFCDWNDGTYSLDVVEGRASCTPVTAEPDVVLNASTLGALYLGGRNAVALARAGLIDGTAEEIVRLDSMFRGGCAPWCAEIF